MRTLWRLNVFAADSETKTRAKNQARFEGKAGNEATTWAMPRAAQ